MRNFYLPKKVKISKVKKETPDTKTFVLDYKTEFIPGQFLMVGLLGIGEAPISISGGLNGNKISLSIKRAGTLTSELHKLKKGSEIFLRGPFGRGFEIDSLRQRKILVVSGGVGLAPIRPLINSLLKRREDFKEICILYGAKTQDELLFKRDLNTWLKRKDIKLLLTVDNPTKDWQYSNGLVTELFKKIRVTSEDTSSIVCGPPIMMKYTLYSLLESKIDPAEIILSLERHMKCGIGKCGHCYTGEKFVCLDGPVFRYSELLSLKPGFEL